MSYVSLRVKKMDDISECILIEIRCVNILPASLALINLAITGVVYYESKDARVHRVSFSVSEGLSGPFWFISSMPEALLCNLKHLGLF